MSSLIVPVNVCVRGAADTAATRSTLERRIRTGTLRVVAAYSPGVMMWAVVVPAFMIHTPPCRGLSGIPVD